MAETIYNAMGMYLPDGTLIGSRDPRFVHGTSTASYTTPYAPGGGGGVPIGGVVGGMPGPQNSQLGGWQNYWNANPDLAFERQRNNPQNLSPEQYASWHYQNYGQAEGRSQDGIGMVGSQHYPYRNAGGEYQEALGANTGHRQLADGSWETIGPGSAGRVPQQFSGGTYSGWQNHVARQRGQLPPAGGPQVMPGSGGSETVRAWDDIIRNPQVMPTPGYTPPTGTTASTQGWNSPPVDPNSATARNPYLNLGLNAFGNTQQGFDTSWLDNVGKSLYDQANQNYLTNLKPTLDSNAIMAGGYGGDRAALAQGVVMDRGQQNVLNAMAPQYANAYESSLNRALQGGQAAAGVGQNLEQLNLNQVLGLGGLYNQSRGLDATIANNAGDLALRELLGLGGLDVQRRSLDTQSRGLDATIANNAGDLALRELLGMGNLDIQRRSVDNDTARIAQSAAGVPTYTNPLAAGIGGAGSIATLLNLLFRTENS